MIMAKAKKRIFMHETTGSIKFVDKKDVSKLSGEWKRVQFVNNDKGEPVMRVNFGQFTMDVSENGTREVVEEHGDGSTE